MEEVGRSQRSRAGLEHEDVARLRDRLAQLLRTGFLPEAYLAPREVRDRRVAFALRRPIGQGLQVLLDP